ncbi:MAG: hypothetical protein ACI350_09965 [Prevotella sp.]
MKKLVLSIIMMASLFLGNTAAAQEESDFRYGMFNHLSLGVTASTTGFGAEVATPITKYLALRGGFSVFPGINVKSTFDVEPENLGIDVDEGFCDEVEVKGSFSRTTIDLLLDFYPFGKTLFFTGGFSFGGSRVVKLAGHSAMAAEYMASHPGAEDVGIRIDKYFIPADKNGDLTAEIKVNGFRPYLGFGFGTRAVPKSRLAFRSELGLQFHGTPKIMSGGVDVLKATKYDGEDDFSKIVDKLVVYPVIKFRLCGRIF